MGCLRFSGSASALDLGHTAGPYEEERGLRWVKSRELKRAHS